MDVVYYKYRYYIDFWNRHNIELILLIIFLVKEDSSVDSDVESMLDSLYGDKWRKKQHLVLPNSEPRKNNHLRENNMPNTER